MSVWIRALGIVFRKKNGLGSREKVYVCQNTRKASCFVYSLGKKRLETIVAVRKKLFQILYKVGDCPAIYKITRHHNGAASAQVVRIS